MPFAMTSRLLLRLQSNGNLTWIAQDEGGRASVSQFGAPSADVLDGARQIIALVPSASVLLTETDALTGNRARLAKAVPFALEEQIASPVEDLHFALPEQLAGKRVGVAVVARAELQSWLVQLNAHGIRPDVLIPESLAMPFSDSKPTLLIEDNQFVLRYGAYAALAGELSLLNETAALAGISESQSAAPEVIDFRDQSEPPLKIPASDYHTAQRDVLNWFAKNLPGKFTINLLQAAYAPTHRQAPVQRLWRAAALLAGMAIVLGALYGVIDRWHLQRELDSLEAEERSILHDAFPALTRDDDPPRLMESELRRLQGGTASSGLLRILNQVAPTLGATTRVTMKGMEYRNTVLEVGLRAPDVPTLDSIRERLTTLPNLKVEVTAANPSEGAVDGRLRISGAKP